VDDGETVSDGDRRDRTSKKIQKKVREIGKMMKKKERV
jgi:hypothetical protein